MPREYTRGDEKEQVKLHLPPDLAERLRLHRAITRETQSATVERVLRRLFAEHASVSPLKTVVATQTGVTPYLS
jgi:hypothetical protein